LRRPPRKHVFVVAKEKTVWREASQTKSAGHLRIFRKNANTTPKRSSGWHLFPADAQRPPVIEGTLLQMSCKVIASHVAGDHTIFIGEVEDAELHEESRCLYFRGEYRKNRAPLLAFGIPEGRVDSVESPISLSMAFHFAQSVNRFYSAIRSRCAQ